MVLPRPFAILEMAAKGAWTDLAEPFLMVHETQVFLDLDVSQVVPITELR